MTGDAVHAFWRRFCLSAGVAENHPFQAWAFGDGSDMADDLAALVIDGPKRATAGLVAESEADGDPLPKVGDYSVVLDGSGQPVAVIRTTELRVVPFAEVDEAFALDEGEGDRTLAWWRDVHWQYFSRQCAARGETMDEHQPVVLERFELVYTDRDDGREDKVER